MIGTHRRPCRYPPSARRPRAKRTHGRRLGGAATMGAAAQEQGIIDAAAPVWPVVACWAAAALHRRCPCRRYQGAPNDGWHPSVVPRASIVEYPAQAPAGEVGYERRVVGAPETDLPAPPYHPDFGVRPSRRVQWRPAHFARACARSLSYSRTLASGRPTRSGYINPQFGPRTGRAPVNSLIYAGKDSLKHNFMYPWGPTFHWASWL